MSLSTVPRRGLADAGAAVSVLCPFTLDVEPIARFLNCEFPDHPVYDGLEIQAFDDPVHGSGMLAFLSRRDGRRVDFYVDPALRLDRSRFAIGGGIGAWTETTFETARLRIAEDGVEAHLRFVDVDGRSIAVHVDDRDGRPRRRATLLAPVGASIERPLSLLLVVLHGFDLVRSSGTVSITIDGDEVQTGTLPGARWHGRRLVKYAGPLAVATLMGTTDGEVPVVTRAGDDHVDVAPGGGVAALYRQREGHGARVEFEPPFPDVRDLRPGVVTTGAWTIQVDGAPITGGAWWAVRRGDRAQLELDTDVRWQPRRLPLLMRIVTRVIPTFRRWPTTYRWRGVVDLTDAPTITSAWERKAGEHGDAYRRATSRRDGPA